MVAAVCLAGAGSWSVLGGRPRPDVVVTPDQAGDSTRAPPSGLASGEPHLTHLTHPPLAPLAPENPSAAPTAAAINGEWPAGPRRHRDHQGHAGLEESTANTESGRGYGIASPVPTPREPGTEAGGGKYVRIRRTYRKTEEPTYINPDAWSEWQRNDLAMIQDFKKGLRSRRNTGGAPPGASNHHGGQAPSAAANFVLVTDRTAVVPPQQVDALYRYAESHPGADLVAPIPWGGHRWVRDGYILRVLPYDRLNPKGGNMASTPVLLNRKAAKFISLVEQGHEDPCLTPPCQDPEFDYDLLLLGEQTALSAMAVGTTDFVGSAFNVCTPLFETAIATFPQNLIEAFHSGNLHLAKELQQECRQFFDLLKQARPGSVREFQHPLKTIVGWKLGLDMGGMRLPLGEMDAKQRDHLAQKWRHFVPDARAGGDPTERPSAPPAAKRKRDSIPYPGIPDTSSSDSDSD
eukprot:gene10390-1883_t